MCVGDKFFAIRVGGNLGGYCLRDGGILGDCVGGFSLEDGASWGQCLWAFSLPVGGMSGAVLGRFPLQGGGGVEDNFFASWEHVWGCIGDVSSGR